MKAAVAEAVVRPLVEMHELAGAADLLAEIWGYPADQSPLTPELLRALVHSGNYVSGAWVDGELAGVSAGWLGRHDGRDEGLHLHSHISGVAPKRQGGAVGYALKQHQRRWALERGVETIEWTFDPLVRRNAYFNLTKLGAVVVAYEVDFYGSMRDAINAGEETDRAVARWNVAGGSSPAPVDDGDAAVILRAGEDGKPVTARAGGAPVLRAWIPEDHLALRERDAALSRSWRRALRETAGAAVRDGYAGVGMTRDGWYTFVRAGR